MKEDIRVILFSEQYLENLVNSDEDLNTPLTPMYLTIFFNRN